MSEAVSTPGSWLPRRRTPVFTLRRRLPRMPSALSRRGIHCWLYQIGDAFFASLSVPALTTVSIVGLLLGVPVTVSLYSVRTTVVEFSSPTALGVVVNAGIGWLAATAIFVLVWFVLGPVAVGTVRSLRRRRRMRDTLVARRQVVRWKETDEAELEGMDPAEAVEPLEETPAPAEKASTS